MKEYIVVKADCLPSLENLVNSKIEEYNPQGSVSWSQNLRGYMQAMILKPETKKRLETPWHER